MLTAPLPHRVVRVRRVVGGVVPVEIPEAIRVRVLRRAAYRCEALGCTARTAQVGVVADGDRWPRALCRVHLRG